MSKFDQHSDLHTGKYQSFNAYWRARINRENKISVLQNDLRVCKRNMERSKGERLERLRTKFIDLASRIQRLSMEG